VCTTTPEETLRCDPLRITHHLEPERLFRTVGVIFLRSNDANRLSYRLKGGTPLATICRSSPNSTCDSLAMCNGTTAESRARSRPLCTCQRIPVLDVAQWIFHRIRDPSPIAISLSLPQSGSPSGASDQGGGGCRSLSSRRRSVRAVSVLRNAKLHPVRASLQTCVGESANVISCRDLPCTHSL
jgi:hypothetical protein